MDRFGEWRPIAPAAKDGDGDPSSSVPAKPADPAAGPEANASSVRLFGLLGAGVLALAGAAIWITTPAADSGPRLDIKAAAGFVALSSPSTAANGAAPTMADVVIDVEGGVITPGLHRVPAGSRVGDAIQAAGGYSALVDIAGATAALNLAALVTDGQKIHVPVRGETAPVSPSSNSAGSGTGGNAAAVINVNTATADELDTLPGIGPVTAAKIIAAREQAPFATVDELASRDVVGEATLEKIRSLVTVGP